MPSHAPPSSLVRAKRRRIDPKIAGRPILMITPPSVFLLDERVFMSLGILKVAAVLERAGHVVELLDLSGIEELRRRGRAPPPPQRSQAGIAAISCTTPQLPAAVKIAERIRAARPDVRIVLGGPHVTLVHAAVKLEKRARRVGRAHAALARLESAFDVLVAGDGEIAMLETMTESPPRLLDADDPKGGLFMTDAVYDESPYPARHLVDVSTYHYAIEGHRATSVIAQLGCPFGCGFCGGRNSKSLRKIRTRSVRSIVGEIELLHREHGFTGFMFYDDELNVSKSMVELMDAISDLQARLGVELRLRGFVKAELFTDDQAKAMWRAGFRWILCGFEAASPRILENIEKRATLEDNTRVMEIARRHGLKVKALMSAGHPGESEESVRALHDWLLSVRPDDFDCTLITTYPGTPYYDEAVPHADLPDVWTYTSKRSGDRLHAYDVDFTKGAEYYKGDPNGGYHSYVFTDHLSGEELVKLRDWVENRSRRSSESLQRREAAAIPVRAFDGAGDELAAAVRVADEWAGGRGAGRRVVDSPQYDILANVEDAHWWWRARREILRDVIDRFRPAGGGLRLLEVGCGSGGNLPMLAEFGAVVGAEREARAIDLLRARRGDAFHVVPHAIPEPLPGRFDVIGMFDVLEHVEDDAGAMRWAARQLEPGGIVVVTVPAFQFLWTEQDDAVHHTRRYTTGDLTRVLPPEIELVHLTYFNSLLFAPIAGVRALMNLVPRGDRPPRSHLGVPPAPINALFYRLFRLERHVVPAASIPFGVSALLVGRRRRESA